MKEQDDDDNLIYMHKNPVSLFSSVLVPFMATRNTSVEQGGGLIC